jgi:DNA-directed RNA polymerase subunit H (RpoH/RPB5)
MDKTMDIVKLMLSQRGVNVENVQQIQGGDVDDFATFKIDTVIVFMIERARITESSVIDLYERVSTHGGTSGIIVVPISPSDTILNVISQYSNRLQIFHRAQLTFDITAHRKVPRHRLLTTEEVPKMLEKYNISLDDIIKKLRQNNIELKSTEPPLASIGMQFKEYMPMPYIQVHDPVARWIGAKPGDIVEIIRKSETAGGTPYYRFCVASV